MAKRTLLLYYSGSFLLDEDSVVNNINNTYIGNIDPLAILLYYQVVHIILRNIVLAYIILYCQEPNILVIWQYILYIIRDPSYLTIAGENIRFKGPVS